MLLYYKIYPYWYSQFLLTGCKLFMGVTNSSAIYGPFKFSCYAVLFKLDGQLKIWLEYKLVSAKGKSFVEDFWWMFLRRLNARFLNIFHNFGKKTEQAITLLMAARHFLPGSAEGLINKTCDRRQESSLNSSVPLVHITQTTNSFEATIL